MKRILVPVDFSKNSEKAFRYALQVANKRNTEVYILHAFQRPEVKARTLPNTLGEVYESLEVEEVEHFNNSIPRFREIQKDMGMEHVVLKDVLKENDVVSAIEHTIAEKNINLVVMGTQGNTSIQHFFFGSNSLKTFENSDVPVIVIPPNFQLEADVNKVVFINDYDASSRRALEWLQSFIQDDLSLHSLHVGAEPKKIDASWNSFFAENNIPHANAPSNNFIEEVNAYIDKYHLQLLAVVSRKKSFFESIFTSDKAKKIYYTKTIPLLGIPEDYLKSISLKE